MTTSSPDAANGEVVRPTEVPIAKSAISQGWKDALSFWPFGTGTTDASQIADFGRLWFPHIASATIVSCVPHSLGQNTWRIRYYGTNPWVDVDVLPIIASSPSERTAQPLVAHLHEVSGLTWQQIAKLFGVSRRAVHGWAAGGRMNARNEERLAEILYVVDSLVGEPDERRQAMLSPSSNGRSLYDQLRLSPEDRGIAVDDPLSPIERLGGADDGRADV